MAKLPQLTGAEVVRRLKRLGFEEDHYKGGHAVMRHPISKKRTDVPCHGSKTVKKGTLSAILKQAGISVEDLING